MLDEAGNTIWCEQCGEQEATVMGDYANLCEDCTKKDKITMEIDHIKILLKNHKCRIDSRKPAGGGVCNICQATIAVDGLQNLLLGGL